MLKKKICAECSHWEPGQYWSTGSGKHGVLVESKGWCLFKKNKRKRWNYCKACKEGFNKREMNSFFCHGQGLPTEEDLQNIKEQLDELLESNAENVRPGTGDSIS